MRKILGVNDRAENPRLTIELKRRFSEMLTAWLKREADKQNEEADRQLKMLVAQNAARFPDIVRTYGWPGIRLVGPEAARGAYMIAMMSGDNPAFQKRCLEWMTARVTGDVPAPFIAALTDRIHVVAGEPQVYGTEPQLDMKNDLFEPYPIEDEARVDERRASMGLIPLQEQNQRNDKIYQVIRQLAEGADPKELLAKLKEEQALKFTETSPNPRP